MEAQATKEAGDVFGYGVRVALHVGVVYAVISEMALHGLLEAVMVGQLVHHMHTDTVA